MGTLSSVMSLGLAVKKLTASNFYIEKLVNTLTSSIFKTKYILIFHAKKPKNYCCHPGLLPPFCVPMTSLRNYLLLMLNAQFIWVPKSRGHSLYIHIYIT